MSDDTRTPEEQDYAGLFAEVVAPPGLRRWDLPGETEAARRRGRGRFAVPRLSLHGRVAPIAVAAAISVTVGGIGAAVVGLHLRGGGVAAGTPGPPPARTGAALAYDPVDHVTLMFGGMAAGGTVLADTWTWDGSAWSEQHPATAPSARAGAAMAWDADRGRMVLFGGMQTGGPQIAIACAPGSVCPPIRSTAPLEDTWTWDVSGWRRESPAHHPGPGEVGMVDDPGSHLVVLLGLAGHPMGVPPLATGTSGGGSASGSAGWSGYSPCPAGGVCGSSSSCFAPASPGAVPGSLPAACALVPPVTCPSPYPAEAIVSCSTYPITAPAKPCANPTCGGTASPTCTLDTCTPLIPALLPGVPAFGWNGTDWTSLPAMTGDGFATRLVADPATGRPLAIGVGLQYGCGLGTGTSGTTGADAPVPCAMWPANASCSVAIIGPATAAGSAAVPPQVIEPSSPPGPEAMPACCPQPCQSRVNTAMSISAWRYDASWHETHLAADTPLLGATDMATDAGAQEVVAVVGAGGAPATWLFDGQSWREAAQAHTPDLLGAAIAADPSGLVLFGGQAAGQATPSNATYTWDGHTWTLHGPPPPAAAAPGSPAPPPASPAPPDTPAATPAQPATPVAPATPSGTASPEASASPGSTGTPTPPPTSPAATPVATPAPSPIPG